MKTVYIAGPFRAETPWAIEQNIRRAEEVSLFIAKLGIAPVCPHTMFRYFQNSLPDSFWLSATLEILKRCDAMVLCSGWAVSSGTLAEKSAAQDAKIPIFDLSGYPDRVVKTWVSEEIRDWLNKVESP